METSNQTASWSWTLIPRPDQTVRDLQKVRVALDLVLTPRIYVPADCALKDCFKNNNALLDWMMAPLDQLQHGQMIKQLSDITLSEDELPLELAEDFNPRSDPQGPVAPSQWISDCRSQWEQLFCHGQNICVQRRTDAVGANLGVAPAARNPISDIKHEVAPEVRDHMQRYSVGLIPSEARRRELADRVSKHLGINKPATSCDPVGVVNLAAQQPNEFHRVVGSFMRFPRLARALGLIVRVHTNIHPDRFQSGVRLSTTICVKPKSDQQNALQKNDEYPRSHVEIFKDKDDGSNILRAKRRHMNLVSADGYLQLAGNYQLVQIDIFGAALKLGLTSSQEAPTNSPFATVVVPKLSSQQAEGRLIQQSDLPPPLQATGISLVDSNPHALAERIRRNVQATHRFWKAKELDQLKAVESRRGCTDIDSEIAKREQKIVSLSAELNRYQQRVHDLLQEQSVVPCDPPVPSCDPPIPVVNCDDPEAISKEIDRLQREVARCEQEIDRLNKEIADISPGSTAAIRKRIEALENEEVSGAQEFYYEDFIKGYTIDIKRGCDRWRSISRRGYDISISTGSCYSEDHSSNCDCCKSLFKFRNLPSMEADPDAEGFVSTSMLHNPDGNSRLNGSVFHWDGWSLAMPLPKDRTEKPAPQRMWEYFGGYPIVEVNFTTMNRVLPPLRFNEMYLMRARAVDIAGERPPEDDGDTAKETMLGLIGEDGTAYPYLRFAPVVGPVVFPIARGPVPCDETAPTSHFVVKSRGDNANFEEFAQGFLAPPPGSIKLAELHGLFDSMNPNDSFKLISGCSERVQRLPSDASLRAKTFTTDYMPDPLSDGILVIGLQADQPLILEYGGHWPQRTGWRLVVRQAEEFAFHVNRWERVLTVDLYPGQKLELELSSYVRPKNIEMMGIYQWMLERMRAFWKRDDKSSAQSDGDAPNITPAMIEPWLTKARQSLHPMITPSHKLLLMHAVGKPNTPTELKRLEQHRLRQIGQTSVELAGTAMVDRPTTGKIEIHARWEELVDVALVIRDPKVLGDQALNCQDKSRGYAIIAHHRIVQTIDVPPNSDNPRDPVVNLEPFQHHIGDTKYQRVTYEAVGASSFAAYFPDQISVSNFDLTVKKSSAAALIEVECPSSARPQPPQVVSVIPLLEWSDSADFDEGAETNRISNDNARPKGGWFSRKSALDLDVPQVPNAAEVQKTSSGLRVYLRSPWWSTNQGERLAVVYFSLSRHPDATAAETPSPPDKESLSGIPFDVRPYVTQWGRDPIWESAPLPGVDDQVFVGANVIHDLSLEVPAGDKVFSCDPTSFGVEPEHSSNKGSTPEKFVTLSTRVSAAGYEVKYDPVRQLYYADLMLDIGSAYFPFIKLVLARLQPKSVRDAELSHPVVTEFIQLAPGRIANVIVAAEDSAKNSGSGDLATQLDIGVIGTTYRNSHLNKSDSQHDNNLASVEVRVERLHAVIDGVEHWVLDSPRPNEATTLKPILEGSVYSWLGRVGLSKPRGIATFRLIIQEFQRLKVDESQVDPIATETVTLPDARKIRVGRRMVYCSTILLPATQYFFNTLVQQIAAGLTGRNYSSGSGIPANLTLHNDYKLERDPAGVNFFGLTLYIFLRVMLEKRLLDELSYPDVENIARMWKVTSGQDWGCVPILLSCGAATEILNSSQAAPGDFLQFRRKGGSPQYGIFDHWIYGGRNRERVVGFVHRSAVPWLRGIQSIEEVYLSDYSGSRTVDPSSIRIARLRNETVRWDLIQMAL